MDTKPEFAPVFIQNQPFLVEIAQYNPPKVCALHQQKVTNLCLLTRAKQTRVGKMSITITVELAGVSGISSVSGVPGNGAKPLRHLRFARCHLSQRGEALAGGAGQTSLSRLRRATSPDKGRLCGGEVLSQHRVLLRNEISLSMAPLFRGAVERMRD